MSPKISENTIENQNRIVSIKISVQLVCQWSTMQRILVKRCCSTFITRVIRDKDVKAYAELTGDDNPVHFQGEESIVHGTYLLGLVSSVMGTKCPGPGTKVLELTSKFVKPCLVGTEVKVEVNLSEKRKISLATYKVSDVQSQDTVFVQGTARLLLK